MEFKLRDSYNDGWLESLNTDSRFKTLPTGKIVRIVFPKDPSSLAKFVAKSPTSYDALQWSPGMGWQHHRLKIVLTQDEAKRWVYSSR